MTAVTCQTYDDRSFATILSSTLLGPVLDKVIKLKDVNEQIGRTESDNISRNDACRRRCFALFLFFLRYSLFTST